MLSKILYKKWMQIVSGANKYGIPAPTIRDPKTGLGSISLTLVFISSILVIIGIVGKWSNKFGTIDINNALEFFYASSCLYFGRQWQTKRGTISTEQDSTVESDSIDDKESDSIDDKKMS